jgi:hypothetical protein
VLDLSTLRVGEFSNVAANLSQGIGRFTSDEAKLLVLNYIPPPRQRTASGRWDERGRTELHVCEVAAGTANTVSLEPLNTPTHGAHVLDTESWWAPDARHVLLIYRYQGQDAPDPPVGWAMVNTDTGQITRLPGYNDRAWIPVPAVGLH